MNLRSQNPFRNVAGRALMVFCLLTAAHGLHAQQQVLAPPPAYSVAPPAVQEFTTNQPGAPQTESLAGGVEGVETPRWLQWGPVTTHPHFLYRVLYGSGIQSTPGQSQGTVVQQFAPGVLFALGTHWTLDYTPLLSFYSSSAFKNTVDENVVLSWGTSYEDWTFGLSQSYSDTTDPSIETGTQTELESYVTTAKASYRLNSAISVDLSLNQNFSFAPQFTSTRAWSTLNWLNYSGGEKWDAGLGLGYEYDNISPGPNAMDESIQARLRWQLTQKLGFNLHGGLEIEQYLGGGVPTLFTPIFGASVQYHPFTTTSLSLAGDRSVSPSLFQGQVSDTTSVGITLTQQLLHRLSLSVGGSYGRTSYLASTNSPSVVSGRIDNYYAFTARLTTALFDRGSAAIFYQYSDNPSTIQAFSFSSSQVGLELQYRF